MLWPFPLPKGVGIRCESIAMQQVVVLCHGLGRIGTLASLLTALLLAMSERVQHDIFHKLIKSLCQ